MSQFELVFYGELVEGFSPQQARTHVAQLFKATTEQVERMFTGKRVVIRNKLDAETAKKYVVAMEKRGCVCVIETTGEPGRAVDLQALASEAEAPVTPPPQAQPAATAASGDGAKAETSASRTQFVDRDNPSGLPIAGEKAAQILAGKQFDLAPAGERLSDEHEVQAPLFEHLDEISLAPVGTDLSDQTDAPAAPEPDTSHLKLVDDQ